MEFNAHRTTWKKPRTFTSPAPLSSLLVRSDDMIDEEKKIKSGGVFLAELKSKQLDGQRKAQQAFCQEKAQVLFCDGVSTHKIPVPIVSKDLFEKKERVLGTQWVNSKRRYLTRSSAFSEHSQ